MHQHMFLFIIIFLKIPQWNVEHPALKSEPMLLYSPMIQKHLYHVYILKILKKEEKFELFKYTTLLNQAFSECWLYSFSKNSQSMKACNKPLT